jgi:hypothetical protein
MSNEIEIKLVLDSTQIGDAVEQVFHDRSSFVCDLKGMMNVQDTDDLRYDILNSYDFENATEANIENWISNSDLHCLPDEVQDLRHGVEEIDDIRDRVNTIEDKLGTDWSEEDNREISRLQDRVLKLEEDVAKLLEINERQAYVIKNIQGVTIT